MKRLSRREVMLGAGGLSLLPGCAPGFQLKADSSFDEMLARVHTTDSFVHGGFTNHAPMGAEALVAMGFAERVVAYVNEDSKGLDPFPGGAPLTPEQRVTELGHAEKRGSWVASYLEDLETIEPVALIQREWPTLCAGYLADLFHGPIRAGHALRSLSREDTPERRIELGHALGHWAAFDLPLPGIPGRRAIAGRSLVTALTELVPIAPSARIKGDIDVEMSALTNDAAFLDAVETVDLSMLPVSESITELSSIAARWFLTSPGIWYLHGVTGSAAGRLLLPALTPPQQRELVGCIFQAVAALHAVRGTAAGIPSAVASSSTFEAERERASRSFDGHVIKLTEACQREASFDPRPEFLSAAAKWGG